jgi:hypothetical protein
VRYELYILFILISGFEEGPVPQGYNWDTLFLGEINTGTWPSRLGGVPKIETIKYAHDSHGTQT